MASKFHDRKLGVEDSRTNFTLSYSNKSVQVSLFLIPTMYNFNLYFLNVIQQPVCSDLGYI
jgi:hypothetical protein